jgi:formylglycine-generating enzyme required for sulfatase activity/uncharacterized caspase-like protein
MMLRQVRLVFVAVLLAMLASLSGDAAPENRVALVIGNSLYQHTQPLKNPVNDAASIATTLRRMEFDSVDLLSNLGKAQMEQALQAFSRKAAGADVALVYFAGHGMSIGGTNYLVPVDARLQAESDVDFEAVPLDLVLRAVERSRRLRVVLLDACRNNPLLANIKSPTRSIQRGLSRVEAGKDTVVAFATKEGTTAEDGAGANSPFARALTRRLPEQRDVRLVLGSVRDDVVRETGGRQNPYVDASLGGSDTFLAPADARPVATAPGPAAPSPAAGVSAEEQELEAWKSLGTDPSKAELEAFLKAFPNGKYAGLARAKIKTIEERERAQARPAVPAPSTTAPAETRPAPVQAAGPGKDCAECPEMADVPGRDFLVGKFEVTFAEWDACLAGGGCNGYSPADLGWGRGRRPVINVSWNDAQAYLRWLSNRTGARYRLLTSEEWEFATRAGTTTDYTWGGDGPVCDERARNGANFISCPDNRTRPVGSFPPNGFGLHDMHGNVWEWVEDCHENDCSRHVRRGGSWSSIKEVLRSGSKLRYNTTARGNDVGFRVARAR